jgi:hypothetical protein
VFGSGGCWLLGTYAALSPARRNFLIRFFSSMREADPTLCPVIVDSAISNLKAGSVTPYKHDDVQKWAAPDA